VSIVNFQMKQILPIILLVVILTSTLAIAHGEEIEEELNLDEIIKISSIWVVIISALLIAILTAISILTKKKTEGKKIFLFMIITIITIIATLYIATTTIYINVISESSAPVHWHADFEIWNCGEFIDLKSPSGISNRIGSSVFHEHNDFRVHVEGVLVEKRHADLHSFFEVIGGSLTKERISIPTNEGLLTLENNDLCNGEKGEIQAFLYRTIDSEQAQKTGFVYEQIKLENFEDYILSPYSNIPPGDCIIIEFDVSKEKTDKMCESYTVALKKGDLRKA